MRECPNCKGNRVEVAIGRNQRLHSECASCGWIGDTIPMAIDHKALLVKYIQHVSDSDCGDCIINHKAYPYDRIKFTPEEWAELEALALVAREME